MSDAIRERARRRLRLGVAPRLRAGLAALAGAACHGPAPVPATTPPPVVDVLPRAETPSECPEGSVARGTPAERETWCEDAQRRRQGLWQIWDARGQLIARVSYRDGLPHGPASLLYPDGTPAETGRHEAGRRVGRWTRFDASGRRLVETSYEADDVVVDRVFGPSGRVTSEWAHQGGVRHGTWSEHDDEGNLVQREIYERGTLVRAFVVRDGQAVEEPTTGLRIVADLSPARCPEGLPVAAAPPRREQQLLILVLDKSGSMHGPRFEAVQAAALRIADALPPDIRLAVVMYDGEPRLVADSLDASTSLADALATVQAGGGTDLQPALELAAGLVEQHAHGRSRLVVMTDGMFPPTCIDAWVRWIRLRGAIVDVAAIGDVDVPELERIAGFGGGHLRLSNEPPALAEDLVELAAAGAARR